METFKIKELDLESINPSTAKMHDLSQGGSKTVVIGKPGTGKCLGLGTKLLLASGIIKNVEDIKVGDKLMGDDSKPRNVLSICKGEDDMFEIKQENGTHYTVNSAHILSLINKNDGKIIDISVTEFLDKTEEWKAIHTGYKVPVRFHHKPTPIDPYIFGLSIAFFNNGNSDPKYHIRNTIDSIPFVPNFNSSFEKIIIYFSNNFLDIRPRIPLHFKANSRETRLNVLAGFIDATDSNEFRFNSNHFTKCIKINCKELADDIVYIARSLGFVASHNFSKQSETYNAHYIIKISHIEEPAPSTQLIPCKLNTFNDSLYFDEAWTTNEFKQPSALINDKIYIPTNIQVIPKPRDQYFGFQLDGNHRFLLADFTVTHNTTLIASLLYAKKHIFPVAVVASGSEDSNHFYRQMIPSTFIYNEYNEEVIKNFIRRQKIAKDHLENPWAILLLDDCTDDPKVFNKPVQHALFKKSRHYRSWYILSLQYAMDVKPVIRVNIDNVFILREPSVRIRRVIWENYASIIPDFTRFCEIMDGLTGDYTALYIQNDAKSNKLEDCIFYYKATPVPENFRFGCEDYWLFHKERYNPEYQEPYI